MGTATTRADRPTETGISRAPGRRQRWLAGGALLTAAIVAGCGTLGSTAGRGLPGAENPGAGNSAAGTRAGGTPNSGTPSQASPAVRGVSAAAARTLTQRAKIGWRLTGAEIFGNLKAPVSGNGPFDLAAARGREVIDLPEIRHQEPGTEHVIFLPSRVYLQPKAGSFLVLPRSKKWLSASIAGSESVSVNFPRFVAQVEGVNPVLLLSELKWGATRAVFLGPGRQIVDHVPAQRFRVSVDLTRALAGAGGLGAPALSQAIQEQLLGSSRTTFDVLTWVDHQNRVVQMQTTLPGSGEGRELLALSYFGSAAPVTPPPASQVVDITSLTPSGERENSGGGDTDGG
jgi:hypothetical protein